MTGSSGGPRRWCRLGDLAAAGSRPLLQTAAGQRSTTRTLLAYFGILLAVGGVARLIAGETALGLAALLAGGLLAAQPILRAGWYLIGYNDGYRAGERAGSIDDPIS